MCEYCLKTPCHPRCPNYSPIYHKYCDICGDDIKIREEYIEDGYGNYAHLDCIQTIRQLLSWLNIEIKEDVDEL